MSVIDQIKYVICTVDCQSKITEVTPEAYEFLRHLHCYIISRIIWKSKEKCYDYSDKYLEWDDENEFNSYDVLQNLGGFITTNDLYNMALRQITKVLDRVVFSLNKGEKPRLQKLLDLYFSFYPKNIQLNEGVIAVGQIVYSPLAGLAFVVLCEYLLAEVIEAVLTNSTSSETTLTKALIIESMKKDAELFEVFQPLLDEEEQKEEERKKFVKPLKINKISTDDQRILALENRVKNLENVVVTMEKQIKNILENTK
jgi:hypothetical protein